MKRMEWNGCVQGFVAAALLQQQREKAAIDGVQTQHFPVAFFIDYQFYLGQGCLLTMDT